MDSITQAALGASVAAVVAGRKCSPKVLLAGALLGTVPDLDVFIGYGDPVSDMVKHRGFSHSLLLLFPFSLLVAWLWHSFRSTSWTFKQVWLLVGACLLTHPLLDAFTSYGTQLFWPLPVGSVAVSSIFIIDPLYTVPLLLTLLGGLLWRDRTAKLSAIGLGLSSLYLVWSLVALNTVESRLADSVKGSPLENKPVFITPTPFNTVLWRVLVLDGETYWEGLTSLLDTKAELDLVPQQRGAWPLDDKPHALQMLESFTGEFVKYELIDNKLTVTDIRLGMADIHPFRFILAKASAAEESWEIVAPQQVEAPQVRPRHLPAFWLRLLGNQDIDIKLCNINECS